MSAKTPPRPFWNFFHAQNFNPPPLVPRVLAGAPASWLRARRSTGSSVQLDAERLGDRSNGTQRQLSERRTPPTPVASGGFGAVQMITYHLRARTRRSCSSAGAKSSRRTFQAPDRSNRGCVPRLEPTDCRVIYRVADPAKVRLRRRWNINDQRQYTTTQTKQ